MSNAAITVIFSSNRKKVLLIKRRDVPVWILPGGGIEPQETPLEAAKREAEEESGYQVKILRCVGEYFPINRLSKHTWLFEGQVIDGEPKLNSEAQEIAFFALDQLPKLLPPPYPAWILEAALNQKTLIRRELKEVNYLAFFKNLFLHPILIGRFILSKLHLTINS
jgi:8-oxo-dGTP diphosphatase